MWESDLVLGSDDTSDDDLVDVVELVPVLVKRLRVPEQWLELGSSWQSNVQRLRGEETLLVEKVERIVIRIVGQQLSTDSIQIGHLR